MAMIPWQEFPELGDLGDAFGSGSPQAWCRKLVNGATAASVVSIVLPSFTWYKDLLLPWPPWPVEQWGIDESIVRWADEPGVAQAVCSSVDLGEAFGYVWPEGSEWDEQTWASVIAAMDATARAVAETWQRELDRQLPNSGCAVAFVPGNERANGPELFVFREEIGSEWDIRRLARP